MKRKLSAKSFATLDAIWSQEFWEYHAEKIEMWYWNLIKDKLPNVKPPKGKPAPTEHRIEAFVRKLARKAGIGNLHVGLTSSDLEDNIRVERLKQSWIIIESRLSEFWNTRMRKAIRNNEGGFYVTAKTHLLDAGYIRYLDRLRPVISAYHNIKFPTFLHKGIGGSLGTRHVQDYLGLDGEDLQYPFGLSQDACSQTGNHLAEMETAQWLATNAALLAKYCNDMRMMFAFGEACNTPGDIASTAIVSKQSPNPWRYEKVSGLCELFYDLPGQVCRIMANCLLERTLTNQSVLNRMFERAFKDFNELIDIMEEASSNILMHGLFFPPAENAEIEFVKYIIKNKSNREDAYKALNDSIN